MDGFLGSSLVYMVHVYEFKSPDAFTDILSDQLIKQ